MPRYAFSFGPNTNRARQNQLGPGEVINGYAETLDQPSKDGAQYAIYQDPGLTEFAVISDISAGNRGTYEANASLYAVIGEHLYKVSSVGGTTDLGGVIGTKPIIASTNRNSTNPQTVIVADTDVYQVAADTLTTFADPDLGSNVVSTEYMDGYTILLLRSGIFQLTGLNDLTIDALDFAEAETRGDNGVRALAWESKLWIFGALTTEIWSNTGSSLFPFERDTTVERGAISKTAIVPGFDETIAFIDDLGRVVKMIGYGVQVISTPDVERDIRRTIEAQQTYKLEGHVRAAPGHQFLVLSGHDWTWRFDASTKLWSRAESYQRTRWRGRNYIRIYNKDIIGSNDEPKLFEMRSDVYDEAGEPLTLMLRSPIVGAVDKVVEYNQLDLDVAMGVGLFSSDDNEADPQVGLRWSNDGGHTWSNQRIKPLGRIGVTGVGRIRFSRLGTCQSGRGRIFELTFSHPVERAVVEAVVQAEEADA